MNYRYPLFLVVAMLGLGCSKEGPAGPAGPSGDPGSLSVAFTINPTDWEPIGTTGLPGDGYEFIQSVPFITSSVLNDGLICAYRQVDSLAWTPLPYSYTQAFSVVSYSFVAEPGLVTIRVYDSDLNTVIPSPAEAYRVVAMP